MMEDRTMPDALADIFPMPEPDQHEHQCPKCGDTWACSEPDCDEGYEQCASCLE